MTIDKNEYHTGEKILPLHQSRMTEEAMFTYSSLGRAFEKQIKTVEDQGEKQVKTLKSMGNNKLTLMLLLKNMILIMKM